mgnify:FL=1
MFTFVSSVSPDAQPILKMTGIAGTIISCITALQSDSTHYYALYTMPTSEGFYVGEWFAQKTVSGSAYNFVKKFVMKIEATTTP